MSNINMKEIEGLAKKLKFNGPTIEQVMWMSTILYHLMQTQFKKDFALIGGSAIAFLYGKIYRLSIDIDMDYIGNPDLGRHDSSDIKEIQKKHISIIKDISKKLKLKTKVLDQDDSRFLQIQLEYKSEYGPVKSVDFDLSYRYCHSVFPVKTISWPDKFILQAFKIQTLSPEELWASKIIAAIGGKRIDFNGKIYLGSKNKIRHLYDAYHFIKSPNIRSNVNIDNIKKLVVLFGLTRIENFQYNRGESLTLYTNAHLETELYPVLINTTYPPTLEEMKWEIRKFLDKNIFQWNEKIIRFIEDFKAKLFRPEDIFPETIANRLKKMYFYDEILQKVIKR